MPDTVIACVNTLGSDQTKLLTFIYRHGRLIVYIKTPGVGSNSDECEVELLGVDSEIEEEDTEITDMEPEGNVEIPVVDMEVQEAPTQVFEINDPGIPQDPSLMAPEVPAELDGPTQDSTPDTEGTHRFTRVGSQPDAYTPCITVKRY